MSITNHAEFGKVVKGLTLAQRAQYHDALVARLSQQPIVAKTWLDALSFKSSKGTQEQRNLIRAMALLKLIGNTLTTTNVTLEFANAISKSQSDLAGVVRTLADAEFGPKEVLAPAPRPPEPPAPIIVVPPAPPPPGITIQNYRAPLRAITASDLKSVTLKSIVPFEQRHLNQFESELENFLSGRDVLSISADLARYQTILIKVRDGAEKAYHHFNEALKDDAKAAKKRVDILVGVLGFGLSHLPPPFGTFATKALSAYANSFIQYSQEVVPWSNTKVATTATPSQQATASFVDRLQQKITTNMAINTSSVQNLGTVLEQLTDQVDQFIRNIQKSYDEAVVELVGDRATRSKKQQFSTETTRTERAKELLNLIHRENPKHPRGDDLVTAAIGYLTVLKTELKKNLENLLKLGAQLPELKSVDTLARYFEMVLWATVILDEFKTSDGKGKVSDAMIKRMSALGLVEVWSQGVLDTFSSGTRGKDQRARIFKEGKLRYHGSTHEKMMLQALAAYIIDIVSPVEIAFNNGREAEIAEKLAIYARALTAHVEGNKKNSKVDVAALKNVQGDANKFGTSVAATNMPSNLR